MEDNSIYFFITYSRKERENSKDIYFIVPEKSELKPECIFTDELNENQRYYYNKIYKVSKSVGKGKKGNSFDLKFEINDEEYSIKFDSKGNTFIYDVSLESGKRNIDIRRNIPQNKEYYETNEFFIKALEKIGEEKMIDHLYKETIELYSKKKGFTFMIELFLKIYQKKDLCVELMKIFKKFNENQKDNEKNMDRKPILKDYTSKFKSIISEADSLIESNQYSLMEFYGIVLSYLNYYDKEKFSNIIEDLYSTKKENLFDILLIYNAHFKYPINQDFDFFNTFISYTIKNKDFSTLEKGLNYIKDIETFLNIIEKNKKEIFEKYNSKIIKLDNLKFKKTKEEESASISNREKNKSIFEVIDNIKSIIRFSNEKKTFLLYLTNDFWQYALNYYKEPNQDNIKICYKLREAFKDYHELVLKIFEKKDAKFTIKKDAINYNDRDEFAFLLDQIIRKYNNGPELTNIEKLAFITKYNPYYREPQYSNKVDCAIFDCFDLNKIDNEFINDFKGMNFENIFADNIAEYIEKFIEKIKDIPNFDTIIKLINVKNLENKKIYLNPLKKKYDIIISKEIGLLEKEKLKEAVYIVAKLALINYTYETKDKKFEFIKERIKKLNKKVIPLIYIEIINQCFNKEDKVLKVEDGEDSNSEEKENKIKEEEDENIDLNEMKNFIFGEFSNKLDNENDIDNIVNLIDCLEGKDKKKRKDDTINEKSENDNKNEEIINEFLKELISKNLFKKDEFFSSNKNLKILLLYKLYEKGKIQKNEEDYYENIMNLLAEIRKDIDGKIRKSKLEEFLKNEKSFIIQRLSLIKLIVQSFNPDEQYAQLKKINDKINEDINTLKYIKDNIILYYKESYQGIIERIIDVIKNNHYKKLEDFRGGRIGELIKETGNLKEPADKINQIKDFLLFNVIYDIEKTKDEPKSFKKASDILDEIGEYLENNANIIELNNKYKKYFNKIKEKLSNKEEEANSFIEDLKKYYKITNDNLIDELTILFKCEKYELDIKSIMFFFEYIFQKDNEEWNKKMPPIDFKKNWEADFKNIKEDLKLLQENGIYDYKNIGKYNKIFTCLYNKKDAIDFLYPKTSEQILKLKEKIQPTDGTITIQDIIDTENCVFHITKMKALKDNFKIFEYIKTLNDDEKTINQFENFSKIYSSIDELDSNEDLSDNIYDKVITIIKDATFNISQDSEKFMYENEKNVKDEEIKPLTMEKLIHIKNQIHIKNENNEDAIIKSKCKILIFFKDIISNLEIINEYMNVLRTKGSSLPIKISIKIGIKYNEPNIEYYLDRDKYDFEDIRKFLFEAKTEYIDQLSSIYKEKLNLRFLYGKQFRSMMKHLENDFKIDSFLRYIVNNTNNNIPIKEGYKAVERNTMDYIKQYGLYNKNSLDGISTYITSLFKKNDKEIEDHYKRMKIICDGFKGIYLIKCEYNSMEEYIINLFLDKLAELPIAQNVLIANKETSSEEIQAFFHRAILCNYNTLFVVEINDSFSEYQQSIMNSYINNLLSYKNIEYNSETKENIDKKKTEKYLESCIVFIYDNKNKNITPFLKEMEKFIEKEEENKKNEENRQLEGRTILRRKSKVELLDKNKDKNKCKCKYDFKNIFVMTSEICGLGKSEKIKKIIKEENKTYFHFPLGGILTKDIIFRKLEILLNEIKIEINNNNKKYEDIAIHLDLTESEETSIINEFFFAFLITKFYKNNENIIYIPKDIHIYIEVPNCFEDYLSKFSILNIFKKENISLENMPPFNYPNEIINLFDRMLGINTNEKMEEFVKKYIGVEKYSYHQINIFIKLFISQYSKFKAKLRFISGGMDVTEKCIQEFANCTKYFTNGGFARLLTGIDKNEKKDIKDKLSDIYENDLINMTFPTPLIFIIKEEMRYDELYVPTKDSTKYQNSTDFLQRFKEILNLPFKIEDLLSIIEEENNTYVITNDNFKKMVLLVYRIIANVPVIIMGDTGCGKTCLITKLNQILNGGKTTLKIINIHPGITDEILCEKMKEADKEAEELKKQGKDLWVFFDEINTCLSLSLLTEIFINRNYNGIKINDNIKLIGACNPYRKRKGNKEKCGLSLSNDNDNELVYLVQPLPQSLLYYVFSFGAIDEKDEKKYIHSIIEKLFTKEEKYLHEKTRDAISQCHIYLRKKFDPSVVSLREIARFSKCVDFFKTYFRIKNEFKERANNEKINKLRSIICSIYLCYYIRLTDQKTRFNFDNELRSILLQLVNNEEGIYEEGGNLTEQIKNQDLREEIDKRVEEIVDKFSDFLRIEQDFLIEQIELGKGIGKNTLLKENVFLLFLSVITNIPLIIIGKPGTGKSLSAQLICKSMRGKYSKNTFFQRFPQIKETYFQGSESTQPEDVQRLFRKAKTRLESFKKRYKKEEFPIIMLLFDELGLAERSKSNPLKVLHEKLEYTGKDEGVSFVGISNYSLDAAKVNRALVLSVPDLDQKLDDLIETSKNIVESISEKLKNESIFEIISRTYFAYKKLLQVIKELVSYKKYYLYKKKNKPLPINRDPEREDSNCSNSEKNENGEEINNQKEKEKRTFESIKGEKEFNYFLKIENKIRKDFHGNRDFYNLIRGIAIELRAGDSTDNDKASIIIKYIERNFGGIDYEIDIDLDLVLEDIKKDIELIKNILDDYDLYKPKKLIRLSSVFLFKKLYNLQFEKDPNSNLKIDKLKINDYDLNKCINDNIRDVNSRYLLLEIEPSLSTLINENIKLQNKLKPKKLYDGSPFVDDNNKEYRFKIINKIQEDAKEDKLIIIENLNQIHPFLFDLYNMNYIIKDDKKFVRVCLENFNEQLTLVNEKFRVIILVDRRFVKKCDLAFLNRLEKMILSFDKLLDNDLKRISNSLIEEINLQNTVNRYENINNYSLKDLLIGCEDEEIQALVYYFSKESNKNEDEEDNEEQNENKIEEDKLRENVINRIYKILPQDIICILQENNKIIQAYNSNTIFYNFRDYISDDENKQYKISIIYTYTSIGSSVEGIDSAMSFMVSEIRSEDGLKHLIDEIKNKNENNNLKKNYNICIKFEQSNSKKIKFISNFILNNYKNDSYHYIFIIQINRNFNKNNNEKIYSLPDINSSIHQIFIDDLDGNNNIKLNELLTKDIKEILEEKREEMRLNEEFSKTLIKTITKELNDKHWDDDIIDNYITELQKYMDEEETIRDKIIQTAYKLIDNNKDEEANCKDIIDKLYSGSYINKFTVDIASCIIEYIKDNIFNAYIRKVLLKLEDNNILTTLIELKKKNFKDINKSLVEEITLKYLLEIATEKNETKPEPKFLYNYNIPGLYNFYKDFSDYIIKNITPKYFNSEKKLREATKAFEEKINQFHDTEDFSLDNANKYIKDNNKFISEILNKIPQDLVFKDYVTYYLQKYRNDIDIYQKDDIYHKLIELLIKLRFGEENNNLIMKIIWIESNTNYIINIFKIFENAIPIYNNSKEKLYNKIAELISENKIKYITNERKSLEYTKEINECYYILLASICYSITLDEIKLTGSIGNKIDDEIEITHYNYMLTEISKILQSLNNDLHIFLNEMYIIDELIKIIELFMKKNNNIEKINEIKNLMRQNSWIIQKYSNNEDKLSEELIKNFEEIYNSIIKDENIDKNDKDFYDNLRYILHKEIKKVSDINYRYKILEKLLSSNEMIKKSKDIFQILLKNYVKKEYKDNRNNILGGEDDIIKLLEIKVKNNFVLAETLLYFFEKNALKYLKNIINSKKEIINDKKKKEIVIIKLEDEPLDILKDCYELLKFYIFDPNKLSGKLKEIGKLFCLGYIKTFIHTFIKTFEDEKPKFKDAQKIIKVLDGGDSIYKMMRILIYKILYNNFEVDAFIDKNMIEKYKLNDYSDFNKFIQIEDLNNIYKIDYQIRTLKDEYYEQLNKSIEKYRKEQFKNQIKPSDFNIDEYGLDNFYVISYNLILSNLQMENSDFNNNFFKNVCQPLFKKNNLLFKAIQLFYDPTKYQQIKQSFSINSNNSKAILFGYRYCLNELSSKNERGIYYPLYDNDYLKYLKEQFYPGNDTKPNKLYSSIINHFKTKPNQGCYVCLCKKGHYHSIKSGFPGPTQLNNICPNCSKNIGAIKKGYFNSEFISVKRDGYYRIFKDKKEIDEIKKDKEGKNKLKEINYMTIEEYRNKYVINELKNEKGVFINNDKNYFKKDNKIIRNLSQISFRILNYILYSHLFFARLVTNKKDFDKYLPKGMKWVETLYECWNILKNELLKENIDSIDKFLSYIFSDLFPILNKEKRISDYESLIKIEENLEINIQKIIKKYKEDTNKNNLIKKKDEDKSSFINLLKEIYTSLEYDKKEFPFYEYFYYTDYLNEKYIEEKLIHMDDTKYTVLKVYLESQNKTADNTNNYSLVNLNLFNSVLNLINDKYFNKIPRDYAEKKKIKNEEIYLNNKDLIDKFIDFYNNPKQKEKLSNENYLCDFLLDGNNKFGMSYINIYKNFAKEQNDKLEKLLDNKIEKGIFDPNCKRKINIQQINEDEILTLTFPKEISFIDILFNSSYRKIIDSRSNESYKEYEINYDLIEENMTEFLLKNKKLLNDDVTQFIYNNEVFSNQVTDIITLFKRKYNIKDIGIYDKVAIYKFSEENKNNSKLYKNIINDFIELIKYLNGKKKDSNEITKENMKENDTNITEETKICDVVKNLKDTFSNYFIKIFEGKDHLTIDKTSNIFSYYLKLIFEFVKDEINKFQNKLDNQSLIAIKEYNEKDFISKKDFACAIRLFTTLVLFFEEDKEKIIQSNRNNLVNYLRAADLWSCDINSNDFNKNLNQLKLINAQISQIIGLYDALGGDIEENFCGDVIRQIEKDTPQENFEQFNNPEEQNNNNEVEEEEKREEDDDDDPFAKKSEDGNDEEED